jgi:hypothetical protein
MDNPERQATVGTIHRIKTYNNNNNKQKTTQYGRLTLKQRGPSRKKQAI